jgi:tungstate transport system substrate-binding protein
VLLVHSPAAEQAFVAEGTAGRRRLVMHNDLVLVGPANDPARARGLDSIGAVTKIAAAQALFVSRGDDSGTNAREKDLWTKAGITPAGSWYQATGQGMGATLRVASEKAGYTLSDRATYLAQRDTLALDVLSEGDPGLLNVYHVIEMTTKAGARVQPDGAQAFADWIVSPTAQQQIGQFGQAEFGRPLFTPDAGKAEASLGT